jgi:DNA-directed RNA polymerase subunit RPC12/RpoP
MAIWNCPSCGEDNDSDFGICWNCGAEFEGAATVIDFGRDAPPLPEDDGPVGRELKCPRCGTPMQGFGRIRFSESSSTQPVIFGPLSGVLVNRSAFDAYACTAADCGKVELFTIALAEISREE